MLTRLFRLIAPAPLANNTPAPKTSDVQMYQALAALRRAAAVAKAARS